MKEIWKDIPDYEGYYQVSNLGRVRSLDREVWNRRSGFYKIKGRVLKQRLDDKGYFGVTLCKEGHRFSAYAHKLVAVAFLNHKPSGRKIVVDHINNIKTDNRLENLQIITQRENMSKDRRGGTSKYTGVSWHKVKRKWQVMIRINGKPTHLGVFDDEIDAHNAYQNKLKEINKSINKVLEIGN